MSKYVKRHHPTKQIIGDKDVRSMIRNRLRSDTCFLSMHEPKKMKDALENEDSSKAMIEEIEHIEKKKDMDFTSQTRGQ